MSRICAKLLVGLTRPSLHFDGQLAEESPERTCCPGLSRRMPVTWVTVDHLATVDLVEGLVGQSFKQGLRPRVSEQGIPTEVSLDAVEQLARNGFLLRLR